VHSHPQVLSYKGAQGKVLQPPRTRASVSPAVAHREHGLWGSVAWQTQLLRVSGARLPSTDPGVRRQAPAGQGEPGQEGPRRAVPQDAADTG